MEKRELLEELVALTANEDVFSVAREINELKVRFDDAIIEMERLDQIAQWSEPCNFLPKYPWD